MSTVTDCPQCKTDLRREQIPGTGAFFSRAIDLTVPDARGDPAGWGWRCPECSGEFAYEQTTNTVADFAAVLLGFKLPEVAK